MSSNVGSASVYEAADQRTVSDAQIQQEKNENRFHEGKEHSHKAQDSSMLLLPIHHVASHQPHHTPPSSHYNNNNNNNNNNSC
jgi:hypothetical protein